MARMGEMKTILRSIAVLVGAARLAFGASETFTPHVFYGDVTVAPWAATVSVSSVTATTNGFYATTQTLHYAVAAQRGIGITALGPVTNVTLAGASNYVRIVWPAVGGATNYLLVRGSTSTNLTNYVLVAAQGATNQYLDWGTNTWQTGTVSATVTSVPWLRLPSSGYTPVNNDAVRASDIVGLDTTNFFTKPEATTSFVNVAEAGSISAGMIVSGAVTVGKVATGAIDTNSLGTNVFNRFFDVGGDNITGPTFVSNASISMLSDGDDFLLIRDGWIAIESSGLPDYGLSVRNTNNSNGQISMSVGRYYDPINGGIVTGGQIIIYNQAASNALGATALRSTTNGLMLQTGQSGDASAGAGMFFTAVNGTAVLVRINPAGPTVFQIGTNSFKYDVQGNATATDVWMRVAAGTSNNHPVRVDQVDLWDGAVAPVSPFAFYYADANTNLTPLSFGQVGATIIFQGSNSVPTIGFLTANATNVWVTNLLDVAASSVTGTQLLVWDGTSKWRNVGQGSLNGVAYSTNAGALDGYDSSAFQLYLGAVTNNGGYLVGFTNGTFGWVSGVSADATALRGRTIATNVPTHAQVYAWDTNTATWLPTTVAAAGGGNATSLQGLAVATNVPTHGQNLEWSTNVNAWVPSTDEGGGAGAVTNLDDLADVSVVSPSAGQILGWNGSAWAPTNDQTGVGAAGGCSRYIMLSRVGSYAPQTNNDLTYASFGVTQSISAAYSQYATAQSVTQQYVEIRHGNGSRLNNTGLAWRVATANTNGFILLTITNPLASVAAVTASSVWPVALTETSINVPTVGTWAQTLDVVRVEARWYHWSTNTLPVSAGYLPILEELP